MDLSTTRKAQPFKQNQPRLASQKRGRASVVEKKRHPDNNLFLYYVSQGHLAFACPNKRNRSPRNPQSAAAAEVENPDPLPTVQSNATVQELYKSKIK